MPQKVACSSCFKAKYRCTDGPPCCRCARLKLDCDKSSDVPPNLHTRRQPYQRRQLQSCDNCRQAKHACDAFVLSEWRIGEKKPLSQDCSRCSTQSRKCTFEAVSKLSMAKQRKRKSRQAHYNYSTVALPGTDPSRSTAAIVHQQQLTNVAEKHMLIRQLLRGYKGFFEIPIWFWASQRNSPYHPTVEAHLFSDAEAHRPESRLEFAVRKLDSRGDLSDSERRKAWTTLITAILAFVSQWLVDSFATGDLASQSDSNGKYSAIRSVLWYVASRQIQSVAGMRSFQVILATMIFALTHPPSYGTGQNKATSTRTSLAKQSMAQLFELREAATKSLSKLSKIHSQGDQSINHLFWVGLIFDTISSAWTGSHVATTDKDCVVLHEGHISELWCLSTFQCHRPNHTQTGIGILHEEAAPLSILLVRKCIYLRRQIDIGRPPDVVDHCINECLDIYNHWIETYYDLLDRYFRSPCDYSWRLLSWVVGLRMRWHWSCLILMGLIERVDISKNATSFKQRFRPIITPSIRWQNALSISDVARASLTSTTPGARVTLVGFGLLNDPWIELTSETMQLALEILSSRSDVIDGDLHVRKQFCKNCISLLASRATSTKRFQLHARPPQLNMEITEGDA